MNINENCVKLAQSLKHRLIEEITLELSVALQADKTSPYEGRGACLQLHSELAAIIDGHGAAFTALMAYERAIEAVIGAEAEAEEAFERIAAEAEALTPANSPAMLDKEEQEALCKLAAD